MITPPLRGGLILAAGLAFAASLFAQAPQAPKIEFPLPSPAATLKQRVGLTDIEIVYYRPGVKNRVIFGGLLPYGEVWRAGANFATKITFSTLVKVNGTEVPAGTYGLFAIPGQNEWTVILNKNANQWGAYQYNPTGDVLRVKVAPVNLEQAVETFTIDVNDIRDESATLDLIWEKTRVPVKLEVDVVGTLVPQIEAAMAAPGEKPYQSAALFYLDHNLDLKKAAGWIDAAIAEHPGAFNLLYHKAEILAKMGDKDGALAAARQSIALAAKNSGPIKEEYTRLNEALIASLR